MSQSPFRQSLEDEVMARPRRFKRVAMSDKELIAFERTQVERYNSVFVGGTSITVMDTRTKYLLWNEYPVPLSEMARQYLRRCYEAAGVKYWPVSPKAPGWAQKPPLYARPVAHRGLAYVDIKSAYWQLARPLGADPYVSIRREEQWPGEVPWLDAEEVDADRELRLRVIGTTLSHGMQVHRLGVPTELPVCGSYARASMAVLVLGTLSAVAAEAVETFPVHAWLTDAAVCDAKAADDLVGWLAERWGLTSRLVERGMGQVYNITSYKVGAKASQDVCNSPRGRRRREPTELVPPLVPVEKLREWRMA